MISQQFRLVRRLSGLSSYAGVTRYAASTSGPQGRQYADAMQHQSRQATRRVQDDRKSYEGYLQRQSAGKRVSMRKSGHRRFPNTNQAKLNGSIIELPRIVVCYQPLLVRIFNDLQREIGEPGPHALQAVANTCTLSAKHVKYLQDNISMGRKHTAVSKVQIEKSNELNADQLREHLEQSDATLNLTVSEWSRLCSSLVILKPKKTRMWMLLDAAIAKSIRDDARELHGWGKRKDGDVDKLPLSDATQLLDSLLLRMHCLKYAGDPGAPTSTTARDKKWRPNQTSGAGKLAAHEVAIVMRRLQESGDLEVLLRAPYSWERARARAAAAPVVVVPKGKTGDYSWEEKAAAAVVPTRKAGDGAGTKAEDSPSKWVSPYMATTHGRGGVWVPNTYVDDEPAMPTSSSPLPALERITLCLEVLDWVIVTAPKTSPSVEYLRTVVAFNAWHEQARSCVTDGVHVPLYTLLYAWETLANVPAELRRVVEDSMRIRHFAVGRGELTNNPMKPGVVIDSDYKSSIATDPITSESAYEGLTRVLEKVVDKSSQLAVQQKAANAAAAAAAAESEMTTDSKAVNKLILFQTLYSLVRSSLANSPHQLSEGRSNDYSQTDLSIVESLMQSMIASGIKSTELIKSVGDLCERNEFFTWYGRKALPLFDQLVSLNENALALRVLKQYHRQSTEGRGLDILGNRGTDSGLSLPALELLWQELNKKLTSPNTRFNSDDMVLAVSIFSRVDQFTLGVGGSNVAKVSHMANKEAQSKFTKMLMSVEVNVIQHLTEQLDGKLSASTSTRAWTPKDCSHVLSCYGKVGRKHPTMIDALNRLLGGFMAQNDPRLNVEHEFPNILGANARLNNRPSFLKSMGDAILKPYQVNADKIRKSQARPSTMSKSWGGNTHSMKTFISAMWSLSALECLDAKTYDSIQPLLAIVHEEAWKASGTHGFIRTAMDQISLEQQFVRGTYRTDGMRNDIDGHLYSNKSVEVLSSHLHNDVSITLKNIGVSHENEYVLNNGYTADIFIRPESDFSNFVYSRGHVAADYRKHTESLGTVIEIDGPGHFETYMMQPLGRTAMKHRHIRQAGYNFISLPYWKWHVYDDYNAKKETIINFLRNSCVE